MKKTIVFAFFICIFLVGNAQSNVRINNHWENPYYINPAAVNSKYAAVVSLTARKQWLGFPGAPSTFYATGTTYIDKLQTQFGLKACTDEIGYTRISVFSLSYAYSVILNSRYRLNLGLAGSYQNLSYDMSAVRSLTPDDPAFFTRLTKTTNYNSDMGFELTNKLFVVGLSSQNIFSLFFDENKLQYNSNFLYAKYKNITKQPVNVGFGAVAIQTNSILQMEFNINAYFRYFREAEFFQIGMFYRTRSEMGALLGMKIAEPLQLYYSYDFNVTGVRKSSTGTHELMLVYKFPQSPRCVTCEEL